MNAPNDNTAPQGLRGWPASPARSGLRRIIPSWEYRHLRFWVGFRIGGGIVEALSRVAAGGHRSRSGGHHPLVGVSRRGDGLGTLTARERDVLALMAEGRPNAAIAGILVVSERSVEKHVGNIFSKLSLAPSDADHRRVLAVLRYLDS